MDDIMVLQEIHDGVFVCICRVYLDISRKITSHVSVYDSHFSQHKKSECCVAIIYNRSHAPIFVMEEKYGKIKTALNNVLMILLKEVAFWSMLQKLLQKNSHNV